MTVNFSNPYHNLDSVSRSFGFNLEKTDSDGEDTASSYEADRIGLNYSYGLPMTENNRFYLTLNYLNWDIRTNSKSPEEITDFITSAECNIPIFIASGLISFEVNSI